MDTTEITEETTKEVNAFLQQLQNHSPSLINMGIKGGSVPGSIFCWANSH